MKKIFFLFALLVSITFSSNTQQFVSYLSQNDMKINSVKETPEELVQRQLEAYNARDIDAFMATYSDDIVINNFPEVLIYKDREAMRKRYKTMFEETLDLFCEIKKRIVLGNKVIDHEYVRKNGSYIIVVAIYEVNDGKISKVTFIRP